MIKFLFIVFLFFVLFVFLFGFSVLRMLFKGIFGISPKNSQQNKQSKTTQQKHHSTTPPVSKKIIAPDEGEYVDYIEIKD